MPPRKRPARTQIYRDDAENPPPSKKMRKSVLAEKPIRNFSSVGDTSKAASAKRKLTSKEGDSIDKSKKEARGGKRARKETTEGHVEKSDRELTAEVNPPHQPPTLYDEVVSHLRSAQLSHKFALPSSTSPDEIAEAITAKRLWTPALLCLFRSHPVTILKLTLDSNLPYSDPTPLLQPFWAIDVFTHLTTLSLSAIPLTIDSLSLISRLPSITHLDLAKTGINTDALCYMIIHRRTLKSLNLSGNSQIDDDARVTLRTLSGLIKLNLHGTSFTMPGLRRLVTDMEARTQLSMPPSQDPLNPQPQRPSIHLVGIPTACMDALKKPTYFKQIPNGYAKDPDLVANLDLSSLKRNINLHATENSGMSKSGNKKELVKSLRAVLEARRGDERVERAVNGPGTAEG